MAIEIISTLKPKNGGDFPLMEAHDIVVDQDGTRLDEKLSSIGDGTGGGGTGGIGITRKQYTGSGSITVTVQDHYVYYMNGYSNITVKLPDGVFTAHFFVSFPENAESCSFNLPEGTATFGNNLAECDLGEKWEISIDSTGGALALRKRGLT